LKRCEDLVNTPERARAKAFMESTDLEAKDMAATTAKP
jgi:hypothetical protein